MEYSWFMTMAKKHFSKWRITMVMTWQVMTMKLCKPDMLEWVASEKYIHPSFGVEYGHWSIQRYYYIYSDMCESVYTYTQRCVEIYFQHILNIYTACCDQKTYDSIFYMCIKLLIVHGMIKLLPGRAPLLEPLMTRLELEMTWYSWS